MLVQLETLILAEPKLQPLEEPDLNGLDTTKIHPEPYPLFNEIFLHPQKREQEALVYDIIREMMESVAFDSRSLTGLASPYSILL